uniref:Uncharacterized protein n=1 Tax=Fern benyvirus TaxID=2933169 RepID=A0A9C7GX23_9VIRU|nr:hypothetical protein 2 [Fern benyvirus]CAI5383954.1 hypothetical protein 2 [Fern benyvirus]
MAALLGVLPFSASASANKFLAADIFWKDLQVDGVPLVDVDGAVKKGAFTIAANKVAAVANATVSEEAAGQVDYVGVATDKVSSGLAILWWIVAALLLTVAGAGLVWKFKPNWYFAAQMPFWFRKRFVRKPTSVELSELDFGLTDADELVPIRPGFKSTFTLEDVGVLKTDPLIAGDLALFLSQFQNLEMVLGTQMYDTWRKTFPQEWYCTALAQLDMAHSRAVRENLGSFAIDSPRAVSTPVILPPMDMQNTEYSAVPTDEFKALLLEEQKHKLRAAIAIADKNAYELGQITGADSNPTQKEFAALQLEEQKLKAKSAAKNVELLELELRQAPAKEAAMWVNTASGVVQAAGGVAMGYGMTRGMGRLGASALATGSPLSRSASPSITRSLNLS